MDEQEARTDYILRIVEDTMRQRILDAYPDIRREVDRMADLIREMVRLEREKAGLDNPRGVIELTINQDKKDSSEPDVLGTGRIASRSYRAIGWYKNNKMKISLLPPKR